MVHRVREGGRVNADMAIKKEDICSRQEVPTPGRRCVAVKGSVGVSKKCLNAGLD